jgi:hypothetical protein
MGTVTARRRRRPVTSPLPWAVLARVDRARLQSCDVTLAGTQGSGIPAGIGADSGKFRLWTGIPGIRDCRRGVPLGRYSGCSHGYSGPKKSAHARGFRSWELEVRACRGECQEEEDEAEHWQVQALRRAVVGHPSFILERMGFIPGWEVQQKYHDGKCAKLNDPEGVLVCAHSLSKADPKLVRVHYNMSAPEAKLSVI